MDKARTGNPGRHSFQKRGEDLYETPPEAVRALLAVETLPPYIWEPAAGRGSISEVLRAAGHSVYTSDLVDYGIHAQVTGVDFLLEQRPPIGCTCIVTNPPYKLAAQFARHAITLVPLVCMLMRLVFLEGTGRDDVLDKLSRVHLFKNRLPRMHRDGWTGPKSTSTIAFGWFIWERGQDGLIELYRIRWEPGHDQDSATDPDKRRSA